MRVVFFFTSTARFQKQPSATKFKKKMKDATLNSTNALVELTRLHNATNIDALSFIFLKILILSLLLLKLRLFK
jgi:hypothetical protein